MYWSEKQGMLKCVAMVCATLSATSLIGNMILWKRLKEEEKHSNDILLDMMDEIAENYERRNNDKKIPAKHSKVDTDIACDL